MGIFNWKKPEEPKVSEPGLGKIKNIIAVASGKGGVGKSTVTSNLAVALAKQGLKVGVMDADLYGPSQPGLMGATEVPKGQDGFIVPSVNHGVKFISMGTLNPTDDAMVVRAPLAIKAIQQFLMGVLWGELDYLLIDLPPGTGDIQLTLAQQAKLTGAIIVTTPQKVATEIAKKGLQMFDTVSVPIIGVIENMSGFTCKHCEKETAIFSSGGGSEMAKKLDSFFLGSIPLDPEIMMSGDGGTPVVLSNPESVPAKSFFNIVEQLDSRLSSIKKESFKNEPEKIEILEGNVKIIWKDGAQSAYRAYDLRVICPCAACVDENTGKRILDPNTIPLDIKAVGQRPVGRYGFAVNFSDGHNTGIYKFTKLRDMEKEVKITEPTFSV